MNISELFYNCAVRFAILAILLQPVFGSPFYGRLLPGATAAQKSDVRAVDCGDESVFTPQILLQSQPVLQACFLIVTADSFGNVIGITDEQLNISASMSVQLGLDVRQQQNADGEYFLPN